MTAIDAGSVSDAAEMFRADWREFERKFAPFKSFASRADRERMERMFACFEKIAAAAERGA